MTKSLSTKILEQFLSKDSMAQLLVEYKKHKGNSPANSRFTKLRKPLTSEEQLSLDCYLDQKAVISEYAKTVGIKSTRVYQQAASAALKKMFAQRLKK